MRYTIFSVDDSRKHYTDAIRQTLSDWEEVPALAVDGRIPAELAKAQDIHRYPVNYLSQYGSPLVGQLGIWYGVLNALEYAPIVTIEDDAILGHDFHFHWRNRLTYIPKDADFFSLFLPRDSDHMFNKARAVNNVVTPTYQRYGGVSMYYTEKGANNIKALLDRDGITGQYDDTLYRYSQLGELKGYCSRPEHSDLVYITGSEKSIVQESEYA